VVEAHTVPVILGQYNPNNPHYAAGIAGLGTAFALYDQRGNPCVISIWPENFQIGLLDELSKYALRALAESPKRG